MSGASSFDEQICVGEYPCGEAVYKLLLAIGVNLLDECEE